MDFYRHRTVAQQAGVMPREARSRWMQQHDLAALAAAAHSDKKAAAKCTTYERLRIEIAWAELGYPYFKVWPEMLDVLLRTPLEIPFTDLRTPFPTFEVALPRDYRHGALLSPDGVWITHLLATRFDAGPKAAPDSGLWCYVARANKAGQCTPLIFMGSAREGPGGTLQNWADQVGQLSCVLSLIVGVALLGTSDPVFVERDIPERWQRRLRHKDANVRRRQRAEMASNRQEHGYKIGQSIRLPMSQRHQWRNAGGDDAKHHLTWGHLRRAHWGWRKTRSGWRLRPIRMARVRPDLPLKLSPGYETPTTAAHASPGG